MMLRDIEKKEYLDSLLLISKIEINGLEGIIEAQDSVIRKQAQVIKWYDLTLMNKDSIIMHQDSIRMLVEKDFKKERKKRLLTQGIGTILVVIAIIF
jgi:hypothetical protein